MSAVQASLRTPGYAILAYPLGGIKCHWHFIFPRLTLALHHRKSPYLGAIDNLRCEGLRKPSLVFALRAVRRTSKNVPDIFVEPRGISAPSFSTIEKAPI